MDVPAAGPTEAAWLKHKRDIWRLYILEEKTLKELVEEVGKLGLSVTKAQLEYKLTQWEFRRNLKKRSWIKMREEIKIRDGKGKKTEAINSRKRLKSDKVQKEISRYSNTPATMWAAPASTPTTHLSPLDSGVIICTPPALTLEFVWPATLPWLKFQSDHLPTLVVERCVQAGDVEVLFQLREFTRSILPAVHIGPSSMSRIASQMGSMMPESFSGEHLYHAGILVGQSSLELFQEVLRLTIYSLSNNLLSLVDNKRKWREISALLSQSGVMSHRFDITKSHDTTIAAFSEKTFQAAVYFAVREGDGDMELPIIKWLLSCGYDVNSLVPFQKYKRTLTALHASILWGRKTLVQFLLDHGADVNLTLSQRTPLELALGSLRSSMFELNSLPYLDAATRVEIAHLLLSRDATVNLPMRDDCETALYLAFRIGDIDLIKTIMSQSPEFRLGFRPTTGLIYENTPLCDAAGFKPPAPAVKETALEVVKYVLKSLAPHELSSSSYADLLTADVFISAAAAGNYQVLEYLSKLSRNFTAPNKFGVTALHAAVQSHNTPVCRFLLQLGYPIMPSANYLSPLHIASSQGNMAMVGLLLSHGANVNACVELNKVVFERHIEVNGDYEWDAPFGMEMRSGKITPLRLSLGTYGSDCGITLIKAGAKLYGGEIVLAAYHHGTSELLSALINAGGDPNERSTDGETSLQLVLEMMEDDEDDEDDGEDEALNRVETLLEGGAAMEGGELVQAILKERWDLAKLLTKYGAKLASCGDSGVTGYEAVILSNRHAMVESVFRRKKYDPACLCAAVAMNNETMVHRFLSNRPAKRLPDALETTAIGLAAMKNDLSLLQLMVTRLPHQTACVLPFRLSQENGQLEEVYFSNRYFAGDMAFWHRTQTLRGSPLTYAIKEQKMDAFSSLLGYGYKPDWITWVCLAKYNRAIMASALSQKGYTIESAGRHISSTYGPLYYALSNGSVDMVRLLLGAGAPVNEIASQIPGGRTPLQLAVERTDMDNIKILLDAGADVNAPPARNSGATALQLTAITGHLGIAKLLLESGADINAPRARKNGRTALEAAAEHGRIDMIQFLLDHGDKTDGIGRRQYAHSVWLATKGGHYTAAELLKCHGRWTEADEEIAGDANNLDKKGWWSDEDDLDNMFDTAGQSTDHEGDDDQEDGEDEDDEDEDDEDEDGEDEDGENDEDDNGDADDNVRANEENRTMENGNNGGGRAGVESEHRIVSKDDTLATSGCNLDQELWGHDVGADIQVIPDHQEEMLELPDFIDWNGFLENCFIEDDIILGEEFK